MTITSKALAVVALAASCVDGLGVIPEAASAAKPTITIGTKNFTEQSVLGELYKQALEAKGHKVTLKHDIGS
jgi:glycine betaine/choline ABC-type transport system substrate-binding protein